MSLLATSEALRCSSTRRRWCYCSQRMSKSESSTTYGLRNLHGHSGYYMLGILPPRRLSGGRIPELCI